MENFLEFGPLLGSPESITRPQGLVREIRAQLLQRYISRSQGSGTTGHQGAQGMEDIDPQKWPLLTTNRNPDVVGAALLAVKELFDNSSQRPVVPILKQICSAATTANETPSRYVEAMIALWYSDASRQISRDASLEPEVPDANKYSNLGLLAMLLAVESWADPKDPALYEACLVSSAATSMIFAASLLSHHSEYAPWKAVASVVPVHHSVKAFLKCSWSVYRYGTHEPMRGPGYLSGALSQDAKLSVDGRRLLVPRNGTWARPDYWHPCKQTFGSPWNKFFKNSKKRIFTKKIPSSSPITYRMPSTAIKLAEMFEDYYFDLGERFDTVRVHIALNSNHFNGRY